MIYQFIALLLVSSALAQSASPSPPTDGPSPSPPTDGPVTEIPSTDSAVITESSPTLPPTTTNFVPTTTKDECSEKERTCSSAYDTIRSKSKEDVFDPTDLKRACNSLKSCGFGDFKCSKERDFDYKPFCTPIVSEECNRAMIKNKGNAFVAIYTRTVLSSGIFKENRCSVLKNESGMEPLTRVDISSNCPYSDIYQFEKFVQHWSKVYKCDEED